MFIDIIIIIIIIVIVVIIIIIIIMMHASRRDQGSQQGPLFPRPPSPSGLQRGPSAPWRRWRG